MYRNKKKTKVRIYSYIHEDKRAVKRKKMAVSLGSALIMVMLFSAYYVVK